MILYNEVASRWWGKRNACGGVGGGARVCPLSPGHCWDERPAIRTSWIWHMHAFLHLCVSCSQFSGCLVSVSLGHCLSFLWIQLREIKKERGWGERADEDQRRREGQGEGGRTLVQCALWRLVTHKWDNTSQHHICLVIQWLVRIYSYLCFELEKKFSNLSLFADASEWDCLGWAYIFPRCIAATLFLGFLQEERGVKASWKSRQHWPFPALGPGAALRYLLLGFPPPLDLLTQLLPSLDGPSVHLSISTACLPAVDSCLWQFALR